MRTLLIIVLVAAFGWSAYWWIGSSAHERAVTGWLEERRTSGWVANYAELKVQGYPNRFDTTINDLEIANPSQNWSWTAPLFQVLSLSYQPNHIIAVWPTDQVIATPDQRVTVTSQDMRASAKFEPNTQLALQTSTLTIDALSLESTDGWAARLDNTLLATRQNAEIVNAHDIAFNAQNLTLPAKMKALLDPKNILSETFDAVTINGTLGFSAPWDRTAVEGQAPVLTLISLDKTNFTWGDLSLAAVGSIEINSAGTPMGAVEIRAKNWRKMLDLARDSGAISDDLANGVKTGLKLLSRLSGNPETLNIPLKFKNNKTYLGPIPIGPAPRFN